MLLMRPRCTHGVRFARAGLPVSQNRNIVALQEGSDTITQVVPHALLVDRLGKDAIKHKQFAALRHVNGEVGRRRDLDHGPLKTLGNQVIAGIGWAERRTNANSCWQG